MSDSYHAGSQATPSADLLARLARRFGQSPGHAACVALQLGDPVPHKGRAPVEPAPAPGRSPRGGHTELMLARFAHEDARIRGGGELPAVWSAYS